MKRVLVAATVVLAILLGSASLASAAQLNLLPESLGAFTISDRCTSAVTVSPTTVTSGSALGVQVAGLTNECAGREIQLTLFGASGAAIVTATTTIAAAGATSADVTTTSFTAADIAGAAVTIGTWGVPATWSYTPATSPTQPSGPITAGNDDTFVDVTWELKSNNPVQVCFTLVVSSTPDEAWAVDVDLGASPFNGVTSGFSAQSFDPALVSMDYTSRPGHLVLTGLMKNAQNDWRIIDAGKSLSFQYCNHSLPNPPNTPSAYSVTPPSKGTWTDSEACIVRTVQGNGSSMFYFGWEFDVDMSEAIAKTSASRIQSSVDSEVVRTDVGGGSFQVKGLGRSSIKESGTFTYTLCAYKY